MPRQWELTVEDFEPRKLGRLYKVRVLNVEKRHSPQGLLVTIEDLDSDQLGRTTTVILPLPIRPSGIARDFFIACGQEVAVGKRVSPKATVGAIMNVRFDVLPGDEVPQVVAFESLSAKEPIDDQ